MGNGEIRSAEHTVLKNQSTDEVQWTNVKSLLPARERRAAVVDTRGSLQVDRRGEVPRIGPQRCGFLGSRCQPLTEDARIEQRALRPLPAPRVRDLCALCS